MISAMILASCLVRAQSVDLPKVHIALYAPDKNGSPLQILSFTYAHSAIGVVVRNDSGKTVTGFRIGGVVSVPLGCSNSKRESEEYGTQTGSGLKNLRIRPHQTAASLGSDPPFDAVGLVFAARNAKAAYVSVGVGIGEVTFADRTVWHHRGDAASEVRPPYEISSRGTDVCKTEDVSTAIDTLGKILRVGFKPGPALQVTGSPRATPGLSFTCLLNEAIATCPEGQ